MYLNAVSQLLTKLYISFSERMYTVCFPHFFQPVIGTDLCHLLKQNKYKLVLIFILTPTPKHTDKCLEGLRRLIVQLIDFYILPHGVIYLVELEM